MNQIPPGSPPASPTVLDGVHFAHEAVEFAALALIAKGNGWKHPELHLYALAIELSFKSLALRSGATPEQCKKASHRISDMIALIETCGTRVPQRLKDRLSDDRWFKSFLLLTRYPVVSEQNSSIDTTIFLHPDYPEMIAEILEAPCTWSLSFEGGNALSEIQSPPSHMTMMRFTERRKTVESPSCDADTSVHEE